MALPDAFLTLALGGDVTIFKLVASSSPMEMPTEDDVYRLLGSGAMKSMKGKGQGKGKGKGNVPPPKNGMAHRKRAEVPRHIAEFVLEHFNAHRD